MQPIPSQYGGPTIPNNTVLALLNPSQTNYDASDQASYIAPDLRRVNADMDFIHMRNQNQTNYDLLRQTGQDISEPRPFDADVDFISIGYQTQTEYDLSSQTGQNISEMRRFNADIDFVSTVYSNKSYNSFSQTAHGAPELGQVNLTKVWRIALPYDTRIYCSTTNRTEID